MKYLRNYGRINLNNYRLQSLDQGNNTRIQRSPNIQHDLVLRNKEKSITVPYSVVFQLEDSIFVKIGLSLKCALTKVTLSDHVTLPSN